MKLINICNRVIEYSFYAIFLLIPLAIGDLLGTVLENLIVTSQS